MALISPDELREHVNTPLGDPALQRIIQANDDDIIERYGPLGAVTISLLGGGGRFLRLPRPASAFTTVVELRGFTPITLATNDYFIHTGGRYVERLENGTNPWDAWGDRITLTYTPIDDSDRRKLVLIQLCELDIAFTPGISEQDIGDYRERQAQTNMGKDYQSQREDILASLAPLGLQIA
jgi:hypothetical protein